MTRFYLHIAAGRLIRDEEGEEFATLDDAVGEAIQSARSLLREAIREGRLPLNDRIEITDERGHLIRTVPFREAVRIDG